MQIPLQIRFRNIEASPAIEAAVVKHAKKLELFRDDIVSCRVTVEAPHKHQHRGNIYHIVVDVRTEGDEVVVSRMPDDEQAHEDIYVAIRDAFKAARRQLQDQIKIRRGHVKKHETPPPGGWVK
jgi:ribosome-associated translation inhibitor RaiA